ncbi:MAG: AMP-binding protein [Caulobacterales bacterium]
MTEAGLPSDTMLHVLQWRAATMPDQIAAWFEREPLSYGALWTGIEAAAAVLRAAGVDEGDRVVIALPNGLGFFPAFYGAQLASAIAVPVMPAASPARLGELAARCGARAVVVPDEAQGPVIAALGGAVKVLSPGGLAWMERAASLPLPSAEQVAYLQYTSGSTGDPKGVMITHRALITNARQMIERMRITEAERLVSWLPVYHDMGLILMTVAPMYLGAQTHLLPTSLTDIDHWLETIERVKATFTGAPDFAWRLCVRRPLKRPYDLSSLRLAPNGAEPVRADTIRAFEETFALPGVMASGYGLAEATVGVSLTRPGERPRIDARGNVSAGPPFVGVEIEIRRQGRLCAPGEVGDIHVRSLANSNGYFGDPEATAALFDDRGFLATGDLGYLDDGGELFVIGRKKNSIIVAGRTIAPREVEEAAEASPLVRFAAALGVDRGERAGEQIVVLAEVRAEGADAQALAQTARAIVLAVNEKVGMRPLEVLLLAPRAIPLTHNGKVQHARLRGAYLDGSLARSGAVLYPPPV